MGWQTITRNHLHPLMKQRTSWNYAKISAGRDGLIADLGPWSGSSNRVMRVLKPWDGVGESGGVYIFPERTISHM